MKILLIVPRVVEKFLAKFPEYTRNAYPYFNYDKRVVNERVNRNDAPSTYKGPDEFNDNDYEALVMYAKTLINPMLQKYSAKAAAEDALNIAVRSYANGRFDGKVNANKFEVLVKAMLGPAVGYAMAVTAAKKRVKPVSQRARKILEKEIGITRKDLLMPSQVRPSQSAPTLVKRPGGGIGVKEDAPKPVKKSRQACVAESFLAMQS